MPSASQTRTAVAGVVSAAATACAALGYGFDGYGPRAGAEANAADAATLDAPGDGPAPSDGTIDAGGDAVTALDASPADAQDASVCSTCPAPNCRIGPGLQANAPWPVRGRCVGHQARGPSPSLPAAVLAWTFPGRQFGSSAVASDGTIYASSADAFYALFPDGGLRWTVPEAGTQLSSAAIGADGTVFVGGGSRLYALRADGSEAWGFTAPRQAIVSTPVVADDGTVFVGTHGAEPRLYAFRPADGTKKWEAALGDIRSGLALGGDGSIYVATTGYTYAVDPTTGNTRWTFTSGSNLPPVLADDGTLFIASGYLYALDATTGQKKWQFAPSGQLKAEPAIGVDGTVYLPNDEGTLYAIDPATGAQKWSFETGESFLAPPAVVGDGTIYVVSINDKLYAVDPATGTSRWAVTVPHGYTAGPAVAADGTLYVGTLDGLCAVTR